LRLSATTNTFQQNQLLDYKMSQTRGEVIADGLKLSIGHAQQLLDGVTPEQFARFATPGGKTVESNHPAFIYGHLALYASRVVQMSGRKATLAPENFDELFSNNATCVDDPDGSVYPPMDVVTDVFFSGYQAALDAVTAASDESLANPNPAGGKLTERFPTVGSMCNFMSCGHIMMHLGQMSAWRRMQGLGPAG